MHPIATRILGEFDSLTRLQIELLVELQRVIAFGAADIGSIPVCSIQRDTSLMDKSS